eukprot:174342_1
MIPLLLFYLSRYDLIGSIFFDKFKAVTCSTMASWHCTSCDLFNSLHRQKCQACFNSKPKQLSTCTTLHHKLTPKTQEVKRLMVHGYLRNWASSIVPLDIVQMCIVYYDEVIYWKIHINKGNNNNHKQNLNISSEDKDEDNDNNLLYGDIFTMNQIIFKCSFQPSPSFYENKYSFMYLNALLPDNVQEIKVYSEVFCAEIDALFRLNVNFNSFSSTNVWLSEQYTFDSLNQYDDIFIGCYFEIVSIKYSDNTPPFYKPIYMKKETHFQWNIDKTLLEKLKSAIPRQIFFSDTFDEINNNWGLWLIPMGEVSDVELEDRNALLLLRLYKMPTQITRLTVEGSLWNSYNNSKTDLNATFEMDTDSMSYCYFDLFESSALFNANSLSFKLHFKIVAVEWFDMCVSDNIIQQ